MKEEDFVEYLIAARTHDTVLCFTNHGKVYWLKVYQLPQANRAARGRPIINILPLAEGEKVNAFLPVREYLENQYVVMATSMGMIKKVSLVEFSRPRSSGIIAIALNEGDYWFRLISPMAITISCYLPMLAKSYVSLNQKYVAWVDRLPVCAALNCRMAKKSFL